MTLQEILSLKDISDKINQLKQHRKTELPDVDKLLNSWNPKRHNVMDKEKRPDEVRVVEPEEKDITTGKIVKSAKTIQVPVNRIALPLEQDIVNIHTSFTVGEQPTVDCDTDDEKEEELFKIIKQIDRKNKTKYLNKRIVRSWLSEQEVAEYWYSVKDDNFWRLILSKIKSSFGIKNNAERKLKCTVWSPFNGDKLYPFFDETGDYKALSREYKIRKSETELELFFMTITDTDVYTWKNSGKDWEVVAKQTFKHNFAKNPTIYAYRNEPLCENITQIRDRLEITLSNYADCIDYNFAPKLVAEGVVLNNNPKASRGGMVQIDNGGKLYYLSWQQSPEAAKLEIDTYIQQAYGLTNTPRISFENLKGTGNAFSGVAFRYAFMGIQMAVKNHAEVIGEYIQRRYNFLASAVGSINTAYSDAAQTIDIETEIVPYTINSLEENIKLAIAATGGEKIASLKTGILLAGLIDADKVDTELEAITNEESAKRRNDIFEPTE